MSRSQSSAVREVWLSSPDLLERHVKKIQSRVDQYIDEFRADVATLELFLRRWHPLPISHQFVANRMERLKPELDAFLLKAQELALQAMSSRSALAQVEKNLGWYATSPDARTLLKRTLQECQVSYEPEFERTLLTTERTTLGEIRQSDEDFFVDYLDASRPRLTVYRGDGRGVNAQSLAGYVREPILAGGRPDVSFFGVVQHLESSTHKNGMVSTTTDRAQALDWALDGKKYGLLYTLSVTRYIDTIDLLRQRNFKHRFPAQLEVLVPDRIPVSEIVSVELFSSDRRLLGTA